jgi:WD40 repeat protein
MRRLALMLTFALLTAGRGLLAQELKECPSPEGEPSQVALRPDGKMVATVIWAVVSRKPQAQVKLWDLASGKEVITFVCQTHGLQALAFSPDGRLLAAVGSGRVMVWDVAAGKQLVTFRVSLGAPVTTLAFSADGKRLGATGRRDVQLWEVASGKQLSSFKVLVPADGSAFSPDLRTLASPNYQEIDLWDVTTGKLRATLSEHRGQVWYVEFSGDNKTLVAVSHLFDGKRKYTGEIRLWDVTAGRERAVFQEEIGCVFPARLSPDGKTLAALDRGIDIKSRLKLLDVATGKHRVIRPPSDHLFASLAFARDGRLFVMGAPDYKEAIKLWEVTLPKREGR